MDCNGSDSPKYGDKYIEAAINTKFCGLQIDNHLNWKSHIGQLVPKLS
jgi:hypothetical protein